MAGFPLCPDCRREYEDPGDRRFHAEPIACPACGPRLSVPLEEAVGVLLSGGIVAVKGLGGYHLACDAESEEAVVRLRSRKGREEKPLAVMTAAPELLADPTVEEDALLRSPARPIVLLRRREDAPIAEAVAPGSPWLGLMLPYTPLHHLLCTDTGRALVMTSGNLTDEPIAFDDTDAERRLGRIADLFLSHDRPIHRRCEDSVVRVGFPIRRSRGYAPTALRLPVAAERPLVAAGAELKSTFTVVRGGEAFLSAHLGDLSSEHAYTAFRADLELYLDMLGVEPAAIACDLHPDYLSTRWAWEQGLPLVEVQHHHAHAAACLAEHGETGPALAVVLDGTGLGTDGTIWGGEVLRCDLRDFERVAHLEPVALPGGEAAVHEPWRVAAAYLERAERPVPWERWAAVRQSLDVNAPLSSGAGRLFDAASAVLGIRERVSYEAQAAIELEHLAGDAVAAPYTCRVEDGVVHGADLVAAVYDDVRSGREAERDRRRLPRGRRSGVRRRVRRGREGRNGRPLGGLPPEPASARLSALRARARGIPRPHPRVRAPERRGGELRSGGSGCREARVMCLGIPGQIVDIADREGGLATVDVSGVRRSVSVALVDEPSAPVEEGDWVLIHVGFALARIDEEQARETLELLHRGLELQRELDEMRHGTVA